MKTVALIPIKLGSKRIPQKNIKPFFDGTPLMHFVQKTCLESKLIDEVYIYCSDEAVKDYILPEARFQPINFDSSHFPRTQDFPDIYGETSIAYVFTKESFVRSLGYLMKKKEVA